MKKKSLAQNVKNKKTRVSFKKKNLQLLPNNATFFCTRPEKKIDTRKPRKGISRNAKNQKKRNKDDAMRKNMRQNTEEKRVQKSKTPFRLQKKLTTENFEFVWAKKTDTQMKKKTSKAEGRKEE